MTRSERRLPGFAAPRPAVATPVTRTPRPARQTTEEPWVIREVQAELPPLVQVDLSWVETTKNGLARANPFREDDYHHVSDLIHACHRRLAIYRRQNILGLPPITFPSTTLTFDFGHAAQEHVVGLCKSAHPDKLYGVFYCRCEKYHQTGVWAEVKIAGACTFCGGAAEHYREWRYYNSRHHVKASVDITFRNPDGSLTPIETKSTGRDKFMELAQANTVIPDHLLQVGIYRRLMREAGCTVTTQSIVWYIPKEHVARSPYHIVPVVPDRAIETQVDRLLAESRRLTDLTIPIAEFPRHPTCTRCGDGESARCPVAGTCFSLSAKARGKA